MKLRWKYFLVLLGASLIPLLTSALISQNTSRRLGKTISEEARTTLTETVRREMVVAARNYAAITVRGKLSIELALQLLAAQAELALTLPPHEHDKIFNASDFDDPKTAPKDMAPSAIHLIRSKGGAVSKKRISLKHPNFLLAPGVQKAAVAEDIARFTRLIPTLRSLGAQFGDQIYWAYASLETGVHISYPGHGGYPKGYDPRKRPWYLAAQKAKHLTWSPPIVDATTNQLTFTLSMPFNRPDGSTAGVAAIDVQIRDVLLEREVSSQWSRSMSSFLVSTEVDSISKEKKYWVMSSREGIPQEGRKEDREESGQDHDFGELFNRIKNKKHGSLDMPFNGVDSIWAYAAVFPDLHFVIVVPKSVIMTLPDEIGQMFVGYAKDQSAITGLTVMLALFFIGMVALFASHISTGYMLNIISAWRKLAGGDFSVRLRVHMNDERDQMTGAFNEIVPKLEEHMRMTNALGLAKKVQQSLLPENDPLLHGFDIAGSSIYCDETGGDYYDFIETRRGGQPSLAVVVGDVSGHGVSSALLMATARALIMLRSSMPGEAAAIINDVNRQLSLDAVKTGNFMTFFYCELSEGEKEIRWVRAGHDPALVYDPVKDEFNELKGRGLALGLDSAFEYDSFRCQLESGQIVLIGTDGIWEMHNKAGEMFGKEALMEIIRGYRKAPARRIVDAVTEALDRFRENEAPEDDITMVVIKVGR